MDCSKNFHKLFKLIPTIFYFIMPSDPANIISIYLLSLTHFKQHLVFVTDQNKQQVLPMRKKESSARITVKNPFLGKM